MKIFELIQPRPTRERPTNLLGQSLYNAIYSHPLMLRQRMANGATGESPGFYSGYTGYRSGGTYSAMLDRLMKSGLDQETALRRLLQQYAMAALRSKET